MEAHRGKLLDAYYADAVPRSLFLSEQRRLKADQVRLEHDRKAAAADITQLEQQLLDALDLLQDAHNAYEKASEPVRKQLNRALFARILLGTEPSDIRVELNEPYSIFATSGTDANDIKQAQNCSE